MTQTPARRTVLLCTGAGAAALCVGCGGGGGDSSGASPGQELARTGDVPVAGGKILTDEKIVVTQPRQGEFKAFSAVCTHQGCIVSDVRDGTIDCACHGSRFAVADGSVVRGPATEPLPGKRITVEGNSVRLA
ncbi:Rieske (2Fe-2S) protein [Streptomyces rubrogriseus]|uniref:Rieske (2Fe-2S) protein n=1 Tax=Streptomyces rubrogriseus TaxID=194673 RepID=UPI0013937FDC|nr:Rieske 2Fe-2S domain-containing protein [Streptomyces sp. SID5926]